MQASEKPADVHVEMYETQKGVVDRKEGDDAMKIFGNIHEATEPIDKAAERRLVRKIDMRSAHTDTNNSMTPA